MHRLLPSIALATLAACSSNPFAPTPVAPAAAPAPTAAQIETRAATRDSTSSREQIKAVQLRLARLGYYPGTTDGVWGPATENALKRYQEKNSLPESGKMDQPTMDSLAP